MIEPFSKENLQGVIDLHYEILPWSINSQLGKENVSKLYNSLINLESTFGYVYIYKDEMKGFLICTLDSNESINAISASYTLKDKIKIILNSFKRPVDFLDLADSVFFINPFYRKHHVRAQLITWVTDTSSIQGAIAASKTLSACKKHFLEHGREKCIAQVLKRNEAPNTVYKNMKSKLIKTYFQNNIYLIYCNKK